MSFSRKIVVSLALLSIGAPIWGNESISPEALEYFEKRVRPLFVENCIECHGSEKQKGGLRLDFRQGWQIGGDSGPALEPGNLEASRMIHAIRYGDADFQMPPKKKLSPREIETLETWVAMGAPDPRSGEVASRGSDSIDLDEARSHWSYQPIRDPGPPRMEDVRSENPIDHFIRKKQSEAGLEPANSATREELVRRAFFALIGLPPTPEQIDAFVSDDRPDAYERLVDSLLASPHYGERWGRHWLDVARFAESSGGGRTLLYKDAWRYRDYVIESFNRDTPFDQFAREQIAGDLLDSETPEERARQLTATAFLAMGPTNYELQDKQLLRFDVIDEQIDTLGKAFLGMTLGCVRCHDHKFDPIPSEDYYALAGIFKSTRTLYNYTDNVARWIDTRLPLHGELAEEMAVTEKKANRVKPRLEKAQDTMALFSQSAALAKVPQPGLPKPARQFPGIIVDERQASFQGNWSFSQFFQNYIDEGYVHDDNTDKGEKSVVFEASLPVAGRYELFLAYTESNGRSSRTPVSIATSSGQVTKRIDQRTAPEYLDRFHSLGIFESDANARSLIRVSNEDTDGHVVADAALWMLVEDDSIAESPERKAEMGELKKEIAQLQKQLKPLTTKLKKWPLAMTVTEDPIPSDAAIRIRGIQSRKGDVVPRGFLQVATLEGAPQIPDAESGRLQLADWIFSSGNPLTARVTANRVWSWLFGEGIVRSEDNFGMTGETPSHPELLDHLANHLVDNDWSIKSLVRYIMTSDTWRQSTLRRESSMGIDLDNRLLAAFPKRRLDAEQLRDSILSVAGQLDSKMFGPNIEGAGEINANSTAAQNTEYNYVFKDTRRSVYTPAFRVKRHELFELFDFANINFTIGQRNTSTVALQALYMLNNPFVIEQSRIAAKRLLQAESDPEKRIETAYRVTLGRAPSASEHRLISEFLNNGQSSDLVSEWASIYQSLFGSIDFRYLN